MQPSRADQIVDAALQLINDEGLEALTMRRLATDLGLQLPAIYRVFASKQAILDRIADVVLGRALQSDVDRSSWVAETIGLAHGLRRAVLNQRDGARIVGGSYSARRHTLAFADRLIGVMQSAGFSGRSALWATTTVFCYVLGESLEQQGSSAEAAESLRELVNRHTYPHLFATPTDQLVNFDERFEFGLHVIVEGLKTMRQTTSQP
ncbi:TetR/AcrR family transcriptional regulator C-terminal domain-containing protein [Saccharomonospora xinjiangensis]|nr:Tetracycline repressor protein class A [Saccharomonospora xinjiangensis]